MNFESLVVYIKFDGEQNIWDNMIDRKHPDYMTLPSSISVLKNHINESFECVVPLTFRYLYALREFDLVGVFKQATDEEHIMKYIQNYVTQHNINTLKINSCYGEVGFLPDEKDANRIVHQMWGSAVYGAIKY